METENKLLDIQFIYLKEEFALIHNSISHLSKYKMLQDQHEVTVEMLKNNFWKANQDRRDAEQQIVSYIDKNDQLLLDMKTLQDSTKDILESKDVSIKQLKEKSFKLEQ